MYHSNYPSLIAYIEFPYDASDPTTVKTLSGANYEEDGAWFPEEDVQMRLQLSDVSWVRNESQRDERHQKRSARSSSKSTAASSTSVAAEPAAEPAAADVSGTPHDFPV